MTMQVLLFTVPESLWTFESSTTSSRLHSGKLKNVTVFGFSSLTDIFCSSVPFAVPVLSFAVVCCSLCDGALLFEAGRLCLGEKIRLLAGVTGECFGETNSPVFWSIGIVDVAERILFRLSAIVLLIKADFSFMRRASSDSRCFTLEWRCKFSSSTFESLNKEEVLDDIDDECHVSGTNLLEGWCKKNKFIQNFVVDFLITVYFSSEIFYICESVPAGVLFENIMVTYDKANLIFESVKK